MMTQSPKFLLRTRITFPIFLACRNERVHSCKSCDWRQASLYPQPCSSARHNSDWFSIESLANENKLSSSSVCKATATPGAFKKLSKSDRKKSDWKVFEKLETGLDTIPENPTDKKNSIAATSSDISVSTSAAMSTTTATSAQEANVKSSKSNRSMHRRVPANADFGNILAQLQQNHPTCNSGGVGTLHCFKNAPWKTSVLSVAALQEEITRGIQLANDDTLPNVPLLEHLVGYPMVDRLHQVIQVFLEWLLHDSKGVRVHSQLRGNVRASYRATIASCKNMMNEESMKLIVEGEDSSGRGTSNGIIGSHQLRQMFWDCYELTISRIECLTGVLQVFTHGKRREDRVPSWGVGVYYYDSMVSLEENARLNGLLIPLFFKYWEGSPCMLLEDESKILRLALRHDLSSVSIAQWWDHAFTKVWEPVSNQDLIPPSCLYCKNRPRHGC